jgi:GNAT superfamily N-acetyltransferase
MNKIINNEIVDIENVTHNQITELVSFHNRFYGSRRKPEHWLWQYSLYEPRKVVFSIAKDKEKIVGTQAMMPIYMRLGHRVIMTGKSENTLLSPEYRGKQVMENLYEFAVKNCQKSGIELIWGFTAATKAFAKFGFDVRPGFQVYEKLGYNVLRGFIFPFGAPGSFKRKVGSATKYILTYLAQVKNIGIPKIANKPGYKIICGPPSEIDIKDLLDRLTKKFHQTITLPYDKKYLKWRVRGHPFLRYREYCVYERRALRAFAMVVLFKGTVSISELTSDSGTATDLVLRQILNDYCSNAGKFMFVLNPYDTSIWSTKSALVKFGFTAGPLQSFVLRDLSGGRYREIDDMANWHITGLWSEGYSM